MGWRARFLAMGLAGAALAAASPVVAACKLEKEGDIPVTMHGLRALVDAKIGGQTVTFIADTGAFFSSLTPSAASRLGLRGGPLPSWLTITGATGEAQMTYASVKDFSI